MADLQTIRFNFSKITTDEFALLEEQHDAEIPVNINVSLLFNFVKEEKLIGAGAKCSFFQKDKVIMVIALTCWFKVDEDDWKSVYDQTNKQYMLSRPPALHLASLTIGTVRGVLHAKTENQALNVVILPPINVNEIIKEDVSVKEAIVQT